MHHHVVTWTFWPRFPMDWLLRCLADVPFYMFIFIQGVCNRSQLQVVLEWFSFGSALLTVLILTRCWCGCSCWAWWIAVVVQSWCKFCVTRSGVRSAARCEGLTVVCNIQECILFQTNKQTTHPNLSSPPCSVSRVGELRLRKAAVPVARASAT